MPTIGLGMIVKNEEAVIQRCLRSVLGLIDTWVICDTGSTDATQKLAMEVLDGVPGEWHERPWVDFAHNRSEMLELARGKADYLLLVDADETVDWSPDLKDQLTADSYRVRHQNGLVFYTNKKVIRADLPWRYVGAAHEYLVCDAPEREKYLEDLVIQR